MPTAEHKALRSAGAEAAAVVTRRNIVTSAELSKVPEGAHLACTDLLPHAIRRVLWECVSDWSAFDVYQAYARVCDGMPRAKAEAAIIDAIRQADAVERHRFADAYKSAHGRAYPARAAGSTVQRYERHRRGSRT